MIPIIPISVVTLAIKQLLAPDVAGLTIWDLPDLQTTILGRDCPLLFPEVRNGFVLNWSIIPGTHSMEGGRMYTAVYELQYNLAYAQIGAERSLYAILPAMNDLLKLIIAAVINHDLLGGAVVELGIAGITGNGIVFDPDGDQFYGKTFNFQVTEYIGG